MNMQSLNILEDLFVHQLQDLYSAETQLIEVLPDFRDQAESTSLQNAFADYLKASKKNKTRLTDIANTLDVDLSGETCETMKGLINEAKSFLSENADAAVQDAGLLADVQRIEHYEISAYGTALQFAKALDHTTAADKLRQTLNDEKEADQNLSTIAEENVNLRAKEV